MSQLERLTEFLRGSNEPWERPWFRPEDLLWHAFVELEAIRVHPGHDLHGPLTDAYELWQTHPRYRLATSRLWLSQTQSPFEITWWDFKRDKDDFLIEPLGPARLRADVLEDSLTETATAALERGASPEELAQLLEQTLELRPVAMLAPFTPDQSELVLPEPALNALAWLSGQSAHVPEAGWDEPVWGVAPSVEQSRVTELMRLHPLVVVKGTAGSGKTHLAVALAGHALARKQRVLVAFPTATALKVFQNRVAGMLAQPLAPTGDLPKLRQELEQAVEDLHKRVAQELGSHAADTARAVVELKSQHDWLAGPLLTIDVPLSNAELRELYSLCASKSEIDGPKGKLPEPADLMSPADLARLNELEQDLGLSNDTCWNRETPLDTLESLLETGRQLYESLQGQEDWWVQCAWSAFCSDEARKRWGQLAVDMDKSRKDRGQLESQVAEYEPELSPDMGADEQVEICQEILEHLHRGGSLKGVSTAFKSRWKKFLKAVTVKGRQPTTPDDFRALVAAVHLERLQVAEYQRLLEELEKARFPAPTRMDDPIEAIRRALRWPLEKFAPFEKQARLSGFLLDKAAPPPNETASLADLRHLERFLDRELGELVRRRRLWLERMALTEKAKESQLTLARFSDTKDLLKALNDRLENDYRVGLDKLTQWKRRIPLMDRRETLLSKLEAGAPGWAKALRERRSPHHSGQIPGDPHQAWEYRLQRDLLDAWERQDVDAMHAEVAARRRRLEQAHRAELPRQAGSLEVALLDQLPLNRQGFDLVVVDGAHRADLRHLGLLAMGQRVVLLADPEPSLSTWVPSDAASRRARELLGGLGVVTGQETLLELASLAPSHHLTENYRSRADLCLHLGAPGPGRPPRVAVDPVVFCRRRDDWRHPAALATALLRTAEYPFFRLAVVVDHPREGLRLRRFLDTVLSSSERSRVRCGTLSELEGEEFDLVLAADSRAFSLAREQVFMLAPPPPTPAEPGLHPGSALSLKVIERLLEAGFRLHASPYGVRIEGEGGAVLLHIYGETELSSEALALETWLEQHLGWNHLRVWPSRFFQQVDKSLAALSERLKTLGLSAWKPLALHPVEDKAQFLLEGWGRAPVESPERRPEPREVFSPRAEWESTAPPRPELVSAALEAPQVAPEEDAWPAEPVGMARALTPEWPAQTSWDSGESWPVAPAPKSAKELPPPSADAWPAQPAGLPRPAPELPRPSAEAWPDQPAGLPLPSATAWPDEPAGLPRATTGSPLDRTPGLPRPSAEAWPDQPEVSWPAPDPKPRVAAKPPSFANPARPTPQKPAPADSWGPAQPEDKPVKPAPPARTEDFWSAPRPTSQGKPTTTSSAGGAKSARAPGGPPETAGTTAAGADAKAGAAGRPPVSAEKVTGRPAEKAAAPVAGKPAEKAAAPVTGKPAEKAAAPVAGKPAEKAAAPVAGKPAEKAAAPVTGKPPTKPPSAPVTRPGTLPAKAAPTRPPVKPTPRSNAPKSPAPPSKPQKPEPLRQELAKPEFGARLEFSAGGRPPAPGTRRPAPPKAARAPVRKQVAVAPVAQDGYDEAASVMLQAFELLKQVDASALAELAEGVSGVEMKRAGRENRKAPRLVSLYEVDCQVGNRHFPAVVSEISLTGVRLDLPESLARDTIVVLRPELQQSDLGGVRCSVRWCRRTPREGLTAGLAFQETPEHLSRSWVAALLHSLGFGAGHQRRRSLRVQARVPTEIIAPGGEGVGKTVDLGIGGLQLQTALELKVGESVDLILGPTEGLNRVGFRGVIVNVRGAKTQTYGIRFESPQPAQIRALGAYLLHCLGRNAEEA